MSILCGCGELARCRTSWTQNNLEEGSLAVLTSWMHQEIATTLGGLMAPYQIVGIKLLCFSNMLIWSMHKLKLLKTQEPHSTIGF